MENRPFPLPALPPVSKENQKQSYQAKLAAKIYKQFFLFPISKAQHALGKYDSQDWNTMGQKQALLTFHAAAERVPAYKDYLKKSDISPQLIKTWADFQNIPPVDKRNYLKQYSLEQLCWDGNLNQGDIVSVSSGSSGKPFLWPRNLLLELEVTYFFELVLKSFYHISTHKTLVVNAFAMGMYVGGPFVLNAILRLAQKGYPLAIATPGNVMEDVLRVVKELGPKYEQIILCGYPPFLKDILENGQIAGVNWQSFKTVICPAGEGFSEDWRQAVAKIAHISEPATSTLSYYGTADAAVLGTETPWSVLARKAITNAKDRELIKAIFGEYRLPSLLQYIPTTRFFEVINKELYFTTNNGCIPLVRYNIHDNGGLLSFTEVQQISNNLGIDIIEEGKKIGFPTAWQLPFVYVFGRSDHTAIIYGANVYPENIKTALESPELNPNFTGRFVLETKEDRNHNQHLNIFLECCRAIQQTEEYREYVTKVLVRILQTVNAEYANCLKANGKKASPHIFLRNYGDEQYFPRHKKQPWKMMSNKK